MSHVVAAVSFPVLPDLRSQFDFCYLHAQRVGEATNPGPSNAAQQFCTVGISNPTSIVSKVETYHDICSMHQVDIMCAAETAATKVAQNQFASQIRPSGYRCVWSQPVGEKFQRTDGLPSFRGNAVGVAAFSRWPIRQVHDSVAPEMIATARLVHSVVSIADFQLQVVVVYGLAGSGSTATAQTVMLLREALRVVDMLPIPWLICGDFNCDPWKTDLKETLETHAIVDLTVLHQTLKGSPMPPTCRGVTKPDNALVSSNLQPFVQDVVVLPEDHFDCHKVVLITLDLHLAHAARLRLPMPAPWTDLNIDVAHMEAGYTAAVVQCGVPDTIEKWGHVVEIAADFAYRMTQQDHGTTWCDTQSMPKKYFGRCQPRTPQPQRAPLTTLPARPGDFNPGETCRYQTRSQVKQVRRLQSLYARLNKIMANTLCLTISVSCGKNGMPYFDPNVWVSASPCGAKLHLK